MSKHKKYFGMGLKPLRLLFFLYPFTKVNGNKFNWNAFSLPSALADGLSKRLLIWALAALRLNTLST